MNADTFELLFKLSELETLIKSTFMTLPELYERLGHFRQLHQ